MILRRLTKHIEDQNWFAVAVDFLIVVTGVFIGIQVANWNESRAEQQRETVYIESLTKDFVSISDRITRGRAAAERSLQGCRYMLYVVNIARGVQPGPLPDAASLEKINNCGDGVRPPGTSATLQEMIASGAFSQLDDERLRTLLYEYDESVEMYDRSYTTMLEFFYMNSDGVQFELERFVYNFDAADETDWKLSKGIDISSLGDVRALRRAGAGVDYSDIVLSWLNYQAVRVDEIMALLADKARPTP